MAGACGSARAEQWRGFIPEARERVRCGHSSLQRCRRAFTDRTKDRKNAAKGVVCLPDPANG
jgi:hypothetical protein